MAPLRLRCAAAASRHAPHSAASPSSKCAALSPPSAQKKVNKCTPNNEVGPIHVADIMSRRSPQPLSLSQCLIASHFPENLPKDIVALIVGYVSATDMQRFCGKRTLDMERVMVCLGYSCDVCYRWISGYHYNLYRPHYNVLWSCADCANTIANLCFQHTVHLQTHMCGCNQVPCTTFGSLTII